MDTTRAVEVRAPHRCSHSVAHVRSHVPQNILDQIIKNQGITMGKADLLSLERYLQSFLLNLQKMVRSVHTSPPVRRSPLISLPL